MDPNDKRLQNLTPFQKGTSGNPAGNTSEAWAKRRKNAARALAVQEMMLTAIENHAATLDDAARVALLRPDILNLTNSAIDREYGKAGQQLDLISTDNSQGPTVIRFVAAEDDED